ncbi:unnamed protein product [Medioppia subpectinata]|uniref:Calcium/calmodulin-dependent protein kinase II association-domain domain-containing protein n=1 Tax=Medioppia subpectinata TaxID=1979941 RepID=A0A7R9Q2V4_9ACAR|nr:unnamed protein product [Medioppia subpectinata]CAG2109833.1 unnamed protein product [Medioppia subpectinata]
MNKLKINLSHLIAEEWRVPGANEHLYRIGVSPVNSVDQPYKRHPLYNPWLVFLSSLYMLLKCMLLCYGYSSGSPYQTHYSYLFGNVDDFLGTGCMTNMAFGLAAVYCLGAIPGIEIFIVAYYFIITYYLKEKLAHLNSVLGDSLVAAEPNIKVNKIIDRLLRAYDWTYAECADYSHTFWSKYLLCFWFTWNGLISTATYLIMVADTNPIIRGVIVITDVAHITFLLTIIHLSSQLYNVAINTYGIINSMLASNRLYVSRSIKFKRFSDTMSTTDSELKATIIDVTERLIKTINAADFAAYIKFIDPNLTSFEPEAVGNIVGVDFHKFYFDHLLVKDSAPKRTTLISPVVHRLGSDSAVIAYIRLNQFVDKSGNVVTTRGEETRVWRKNDGKWQLVHFHRSDVPSNV